LNNHPVQVAEPIRKLIEEFNKLPGIGPKSAQRLTYYLVRMPEEHARELCDSIIAIKEKLVFCSICQNISETDPCAICQSSERDHTLICVVENPLDIMAMERIRGYNGLYHVLHGVISPMDGIGPDDLKIERLLSRLKTEDTQEVILATNLNLEGEATAMYLQKLITPLGIRVTRLARGLPFGSELEYADEVTLTRALEGRREI